MCVLPSQVHAYLDELAIHALAATLVHVSLQVLIHVLEHQVETLVMEHYIG